MERARRNLGVGRIGVLIVVSLVREIAQYVVETEKISSVHSITAFVVIKYQKQTLMLGYFFSFLILEKERKKSEPLETKLK